MSNILRCEGSLEWLVCLRSPPVSLKSSCDTGLIKYDGDVDVCIGLDENMYVFSLTKNIYVCVGVDEIHVCSESPGLGPGDDQDGEDMAGCPNTPEPPRGAPDQLKGTPDPQEDSLDILRSPPGGGRSANPHCRRICPVFHSQRQDR